MIKHIINFTLSHDFTGQANVPPFSQSIIVPFPVDEMIVRQIAYRSGVAGEAAEVYRFQSDLVTGISNGFLCSFSELTDLSPNNRFMFNGASVNSTYSFGVSSVVTPNVAAPLGSLVVQLEFVKYRK